MKGKVLFLVNHDVVIYNFRREIVEKLIEEDYEVVISSPYGDRIDELVRIGSQYFEIDMNRHGINLIDEMKLIREYIRLYRKVKPDIILGFTIKPNIYGALVARWFNIPFVANITGLGSAVEKVSFLQYITVLMYKIAFSKIQTVFFQNKENQQFFIDRNIAIKKHKLLPGSGVNLTQFSVLSYPKEDTIEFVFISRIMKEKGIEEYLGAAEYIRKKYPNTIFHICGFCEEEYEETLRTYENQDIIRYHGMLKDIRVLLSRTHCTVHPTYYPEGLSNVLLESAASGRPLITTDRSGCREVVDEGENGYLVQANNTNDLIQKIEKFIYLSYEEKIQMGLNGRKKVEKEFDRQIVIEAYKNEVNEAGKGNVY